MRPVALLKLLNSVKNQTLYPNEILIIDGSTDDETEQTLEKHQFKGLNYFKVSEKDRGLTKQRNFGIKKVGADIEIVCFLDDDTILNLDYFKNIILNFIKHPDAVGIGGVAINENRWKLNSNNIDCKSHKVYCLDNYYIKESSRNVLRNILGLQSQELPGIMPEFSHGRTYSYPLDSKSYPVDLLVGMSMSFRREIFNKIKFSKYFEGYGLYEDADFSIRALRFGQNYICTNVQLQHFHEASGRPNMYKYGKMVTRNGWYVWRLKQPKPSLKARFKWNATSFLLTVIRFSNVLTFSDRKGAFNEAMGRTAGWFSLLYDKPKRQ